MNKLELPEDVINMVQNIHREKLFKCRRMQLEHFLDFKDLTTQLDKDCCKVTEQKWFQHWYIPTQIRDTITLNNNNPAKFINNVIMVKSTDKTKSPAFCLCAYVTDNQFNAEQVEQRWNYIKNELAKRGIKVRGASADAAGPYLKAMKRYINLPTVTPNPQGDWFVASLSPDLHPLQDTVHIGTKLRTVFVHPKKVMQLGCYQVNKSYIEEIIKYENKTIHGLDMIDIDSSDKMNFPAVLRKIAKKDQCPLFFQQLSI